MHDEEKILIHQPYHTLRVTEVFEERGGIKTFVFEENKNIEYQPGQYLTIIYKQDGEEIRRSYSTSSTPYLNEPLSICVKRVDNGSVSRYLIDRVEKGDELLTTGAAGFFVLPHQPENYPQVFFLTAGVGITPVYSLLKTILYKHPEMAVVLIYSNRSKEQTLFYDGLTGLEKKFKERLHIEFIYSNNKNLAKAHLYKEYLFTLLQKFSIAPYGQTLFYVCGPEAYMRMCIFGLQEAHVPKENIKRENFNTNKPASIIEPPDKRDHLVYIKMQGIHQSIKVSYPDSILKAAKKQGFVLPYSCETGRCGNCAATCKAGSVWMSYNEVLTEADLKRGLILTCTGHPVGEGVILTI